MAYRGGHWNYIFGYAQFFNQQGGFIFLFYTDNLVDLDAVDYYNVICGTSLNPVLGIISLPRSSDVGWNSYIGRRRPFLRHDFSIVDISNLLVLPVIKRLRSGYELVVFIHSFDVMWLPSLKYA